jgi:hypothetical protein
VLQQSAGAIGRIPAFFRYVGHIVIIGSPGYVHIKTRNVDRRVVQKTDPVAHRQAPHQVNSILYVVPYRTITASRRLAGNLGGVYQFQVLRHHIGLEGVGRGDDRILTAPLASISRGNGSWRVLFQFFGIFAAGSDTDDNRS